MFTFLEIGCIFNCDISGKASCVSSSRGQQSAGDRGNLFRREAPLSITLSIRMYVPASF